LTKIDKTYLHTPVLLNEVLEYLNPRSGQNFVDATLGGGGYTRAILDKILPNGKLLAIDLDKDAIKNFKFLISNSKNQESITLHHGNFKDIDEILKSENFPKPDGIVADIGLSSYQLDQADRGISFQKNERLDMRFNTDSGGITAKDLLNNYSETDLRKIFEDLGEEKFSRQIARKVYEFRSKSQALDTTVQLYQLIQEALPKPYKHKADSSARRIFQALRIAVNGELENLTVFLPKAFEALKPGGRLAIVSFHSLEDRIVKQYFIKLAKGCVCPPEFPVCICHQQPVGKILTKQPIVAGEKEIAHNSRSQSAKLRVLEKI
jgi:16S rRNA (cytosine1402-N4)-methyltransferase